MVCMWCVSCVCGVCGVCGACGACGACGVCGVCGVCSVCGVRARIVRACVKATLHYKTISSLGPITPVALQRGDGAGDAGYG